MTITYLLLRRSQDPFEGEPEGGRKAFQEISTSGRKIHQKLTGAPGADSCLLPKEQLFWPEGRTSSFQGLPKAPDPRLQNAGPVAGALTIWWGHHHEFFAPESWDSTVLGKAADGQGTWV